MTARSPAGTALSTSPCGCGIDPRLLSADVSALAKLRAESPRRPYRRVVGKAPITPYPPDPEEDAEPLGDIGDAVDAVGVDLDWANRQARGVALRRVEVLLVISVSPYR